MNGGGPAAYDSALELKRCLFDLGIDQTTATKRTLVRLPRGLGFKHQIGYGRTTKRHRLHPVHPFESGVGCLKRAYLTLLAGERQVADNDHRLKLRRTRA